MTEYMSVHVCIHIYVPYARCTTYVIHVVYVCKYVCARKLPALQDVSSPAHLQLRHSAAQRGPGVSGRRRDGGRVPQRLSMAESRYEHEALESKGKSHVYADIYIYMYVYTLVHVYIYTFVDSFVYRTLFQIHCSYM